MAQIEQHDVTGVAYTLLIFSLVGVQYLCYLRCYGFSFGDDVLTSVNHSLGW